jgi:hypothetical protein
MRISIETLQALLTYEPASGKLFWKPRPRHMFTSNLSFPRFNNSMAHTEALTATNKDGYRYGGILGQNYLAHRVAWGLHYGYWPTDLIDHINHNKSDNRIENLRVVSNSENAKNMRPHSRNKSGVTGVHWLKKEQAWRAKITVDRNVLFLGNFKDKTEAIAARAAAEAIHGFHPNHGRNP